MFLHCPRLAFNLGGDGIDLLREFTPHDLMLIITIFVYRLTDEKRIQISLCVEKIALDIYIGKYQSYIFDRSANSEMINLSAS